MAKQRRGCVALSLALRVRGMFHVILLLCCSSLLNFGYFWQCVCVCVSCVRVACRRGILSLCRRRRPRDKVLSYDLLKCPNATITRDYYKCIPRVQRTQNRTPQFGAAREGGGKHERKRERERRRERAEHLEACRGSQGNKLFWPPTNERNLKSQFRLFCVLGPSFCLRSSSIAGHSLPSCPVAEPACPACPESSHTTSCVPCEPTINIDQNVNFYLFCKSIAQWNENS